MLPLTESTFTVLGSWAAGAAAVVVVGATAVVGVAVAGGRQVATILSSYRLPVHERTGDTTIDGEQTTSVSATHALADGAVEKVRATTTGRFHLTISPPSGVDSPPLTGSLTVAVRSETRRR